MRNPHQFKCAKLPSSSVACTPLAKMSFAIKKAVNKQLREVGVKAFDVAAVNALAEHIASEGSTQALTDFIGAWKAGKLARNSYR